MVIRVRFRVRVRIKRCLYRGAYWVCGFQIDNGYGIWAWVMSKWVRE